MSDQYDVIIVGAGPGGIFCAYELKEKRPDLRVLLLEKGHSIEKRYCPKRKTKHCNGCHPCAITTGFAGAGAFSDGKLSLSPDVGGTLPDILGYTQAKELIERSDQIYLKFGADTNVYGVGKEKEIQQIRAKAIGANLKLVECPIRHLGTEKGYEIYKKLQHHLQDAGVDMRFDDPVRTILISDGSAVGVETEKDEKFYAPRVVVAVGRDGADWLNGQCEKLGIESMAGTVDIGVRVEVRDEIMQFLNENLYEAKLIYYTPTFDDKVRTFCTNPSGEVATEYYDDNLAVVNGHAYKSKEQEFHKAIQNSHRVRQEDRPALQHALRKPHHGADIRRFQKRQKNYGGAHVSQQPDPHTEGRGAWRSLPGAAAQDHGGPGGDDLRARQGDARHRL